MLNVMLSYMVQCIVWLIWKVMRLGHFPMTAIEFLQGFLSVVYMHIINILIYMYDQPEFLTEWGKEADCTFLQCLARLPIRYD